MNHLQNDEIVVYTSKWCGHSVAVERFLTENNVPVKLIDIGADKEAREALVAINNGYASVPTLVFPDGSKLTEPSIALLRDKFGFGAPGLIDRLRSALGSADQS
jgi:mycoredoxin